MSNQGPPGGYGPPGAPPGGYGGPPGGGGFGPPPGGGGGGFGPPGGGGYGGPPGGGGYGPPPGGGFGGPQQGGYPPPPGGFGGPPGMQGMPGQGGPKTELLAILSLVAGLLSIPGWFCCYAGAPVGLAGLVLGIIAVVKVGNQPGQLTGKGLAYGGIGASVAGFLLFIVFALVLGMANVMSR